MLLLAEVVDRMVVMRDSRIIADAEPREVFADNEVMRSTHILPPQITDLSLRLQDHESARRALLSVGELFDWVKKKQTV
jgi:energy-coupling factor transport system ATP-binding protein